MQVTVFGAHSGNNKGDLAILHSIIQYIEKQEHAPEFVIPSKDPDYLRRFDNRDHIQYIRSRTNYLGYRILGPIRESDIVVIGGGGLFFSRRKYDPTYNHVVNIFPLVKLCQIVGTPVYLFSVGSHSLDWVTSYFTKGILSRVDRITVRDELSREIFASLTNKEVRRFADPAFLLKGIRSPAVDRLIEEHNIEDTSSMLILINSAVGKQPYQNDFRQILEDLSSSYQIFLLNTTISQTLAAKLAKGISGCQPLLDANHLRGEEHIALISSFNRSISIPMHGSIFSYLSDTPFMSVEYEPKVKEFNSIIANTHRTTLNSLNTIPEQVENATRSGLRPKEEIRRLAAANFEDFRDFADTYTRR